MDDAIGNVYGLMLVVGGSGDFGKLEESLDDRKYGRDWFTRMITCFLDNILALEEFMWHYLPAIVL